MNWNEVISKSYFFEINDLFSKSFHKSFYFYDQIFDFYEFSKLNKSKNDLRVSISKELLAWRVANYQLAKPIYFIFNKSSKEKAFLIAQYNSNKLLILDQRFSSSIALIKILEQIKLWCIKNKIFKIELETCFKTLKILDSNYPKVRKKVSSSFFYCKDQNLKIKSKNFIITPLSSDVFLRN